MNKQPKATSTDLGGFAAIGSVIGAVLASSCCLLPLTLVTLGASGAWISNLSALDSYKGYFTVVTIIFLGAGFWQVYRRKEVACEDSIYCASIKSTILTKIALWIATVLVTSALTIGWWAPLFY